MLGVARHLVVALAVLRVATAGHQTPNVFHQGRTAFRIQAEPSLRAHSLLAAAPAAAAPTKDQLEEATKVLTPQQFKMPDFRHADSLSAATDGYLDWFVVIYWGTILLIILLIEVTGRLSGDKTPCEKTQIQESESSSTRATTEDGWRTQQLAEEATPRQGEKESESSSKRPVLRKKSSLFFPDDDDPGRKTELAPNVWALNLVAARGKARDRRNNIISAKIVFFAGVVMGLIQLLTLFLVVYDIDPSANPYTEKPAAPWKQSPLTVNTMKVVMTFFLGMYVVSEAADSYDNYLIGAALPAKELLVHRFYVLFTPLYHYLITLSVILAGVSVVLSCQDVPNILYNSMAILFITRVDELFWGFFERTFDIDAEWEVEIKQSDIAEVALIKKCIIMFPMLWGFCLLGRAWYRDQMPALVVRAHLNS